jgi:hypothetical protein
MEQEYEASGRNGKNEIYEIKGGFMELTFVIFSTLCLVLLVFEAARTYRLMARIKQPLIRTQSGEQELSRMKRFKSLAAIQRDLHAYRGLSAEERADSKLILQASDLEYAFVKTVLEAAYKVALPVSLLLLALVQLAAGVDGMPGRAAAAVPQPLADTVAIAFHYLNESLAAAAFVLLAAMICSCFRAFRRKKIAYHLLLIEKASAAD